MENPETKQCSKCKVNQPLHRYTEGRKQCNLCIEQKQRYREKFKEEISIKQKEYYEQNKKKINEKVECPICKCLVAKYKLFRHGQSQKHQRKLKHLQQQYHQQQQQQQQ